MNTFYPIYLNLVKRLCVVVGGGSVAERKVSGLLQAGAQVRVVSLEATPELRLRADSGEIELILSEYEAKHLEGAALIFAATDRREVNARVAADAARRSVFINVADAPESCDFIVPAVVRRGDLCVSISTGGNQPLLAARLAEEMETRFGPEYAAYVDLLGRMRAEIKMQTNDPALRRAALKALLAHEADLLSWLASGEPEAAYTMAQDIIRSLREEMEGKPDLRE